MANLERSTKVVQVDPVDPQGLIVGEAAAILREGGLVAFPTETVYGLGANALDGRAVSGIFAAKGRPADNPLIVHVADRGDVDRVAAAVPAVADQLMERFWPGPLTLVLPRRPEVPIEVTGGLNSVGVRMPDHAVAISLIKAAGVPLAAPSANRSGRPSPTRAEHVTEDLAGRIDLIVDAGDTGVGLESTVLDVTVEPPMLLRPGGITLEQLRAEIGDVQVAPSVSGLVTEQQPRSPGAKYQHYAPKATLLLIEGPILRVQDKIRDLLTEYTREGRRVGVLSSVESRGVYNAAVVLEYGSRENLAEVAADLFGALRAFDRHEVDVILVEGVHDEGIGLAIMNRLRRAAGGRVVPL